MGKTLGLISNLQLALAHYCDTHGPTPLMVTEGLPASCTSCYQDPAPTSAPSKTIPRSSAPSNNKSEEINEGLQGLNLSRSASTSSSVPYPQSKRGPSRSQTASIASKSKADTPPASPHIAFSPQSRNDSSFRRTYDDTVTKKQGPCDNCAMTLPRKSAAASNSADTSATSQGPTLRTRAPAERVFGPGGQNSPPNSQSSSDTDGERETPRRPRDSRRVVPATSSRTTSCSSTSTTSESTPFHVHYVDYTSTHEPVMPASFSMLRASCLRTLSFETLPRAPSTTPAPVASPQSPTGSFVTTQSAGSAVSGGPIFFGDAVAGYTTAYIFRIPDVHARGHKRVYAFLALSTHKERLAMKTFAIVSAAFRELATWIQQLAEVEAERAAESSPVGSAFYSGGGGGGFAQSSSQLSSAFDSPSVPSSAATARSGSSFLTGGSGFTRRMAGGGGGTAPKARGLAELVGQPDFFIELHRKFVQLLFEVGVTLNS